MTERVLSTGCRLTGQVKGSRPYAPLTLAEETCAQECGCVSGVNCLNGVRGREFVLASGDRTSDPDRRSLQVAEVYRAVGSLGGSLHLTAQAAIRR